MRVHRFGLIAGLALLGSAGCSEDECEGAKCGPATNDATGGNWDAPFSVRNIDPATLPDPRGDVTLSGDCVVDSDSGTIDCADDVAFAVLEQTDADRTPIAVFTAQSFTVDASADVRVVGGRPTLFIARGELRILGVLSAVPNEFNAGEGFAGGFGSPEGPRQAGLGGGGGGPGTDSDGASGGSYCGAGGGSAPGATHGASELSPLRGGSSGGTGEVGSAGAGGGALQLVSLVGVDVGTTGVIHAGGAGGNFGGQAMQPAAGGGSGGAVLLQAPTVRLAGIIAANGGGGGGTTVSGDAGAYATASIDPAPGGAPNGGAGSGGENPDGSAGTDNGGGGGGAGWIRVDGDEVDVTGILSPSLATGCAVLAEL